MVTPYARHDLVNVWNADARELAGLVAPGVDLVITSRRGWYSGHSRA